MSFGRFLPVTGSFDGEAVSFSVFVPGTLRCVVAHAGARQKSFLSVMLIVSSVVALLGSSGGVSGSLGPRAVNVTVQRWGESLLGVLICVPSTVAVSLHVFVAPPLTMAVSLPVIESHTGVLSITPLQLVLACSVTASPGVSAVGR